MFYGSRKRFVVVEGYQDRARRVLLKMAGRNHTSRCQETQPGCGGSGFLKGESSMQGNEDLVNQQQLGQKPYLF